MQTKLTEDSKEISQAIEQAKKQREISISEFFTKNRHLLGFDSPLKSLSTTIKEAVDNALDACEESDILPEIHVEIKQTTPERYKVIVEDNGPGIVKEQIPRIFGKLLYGSKFHKLSQSLTKNQPILIQENNEIKIVKIGEFIDNFIEKEGDYKCKNIQVPCFDWKTYKYSFKPASHLIKHKRRNEVYKISTLYGKNIEVTGCHSLFTINKETLDVEEVEARNLKENSIVLAPKKIDIPQIKDEINILDYIDEKYAKKRYWYLYTKKSIIKEIFSKAKIVHKKSGGKPRKFYRFEVNHRTLDILDDSYKQYVSKGFLPVWIVKSLNLKVDQGVIRTYQRGNKYDLQINLQLLPNLMKLFGLYVAEGHSDDRQIGFTFSKHERDLIKLVSDSAYLLNSKYTIEERPEKNSTRVKLFGGVISYLFRKWFGHLAPNKKIPNFIFSASKELRQNFIDYLYMGDGHCTKNNQLMLTTTSENLANQSMYLWLTQGIIAGYSKTIKKGLGKKPSLTHVVAVYGKDIDKTEIFSSKINTKRRWHDKDLRLISKMVGTNYTKEQLKYITKLGELENTTHSKEDLKKIFNSEKIGYKLKFLLEKGYLNHNNNAYSISESTLQINENFKKLYKLLCSDFVFLPVRKIEVIQDKNEYVYDISVPSAENFIGGFGAISCHNSRGQQGIGISAAALYSQLTTGKPVKITSKIGKNSPAHYYELHLDTSKNEPEISKGEVITWEKEHGTRVELEMEGKYQRGKRSVSEYMKYTAIANPHAKLTLIEPDDTRIEYPSATKIMPVKTKEIKPHPDGIELGTLINMLKTTSARTLQSFLTQDFSRIGAGTAKKICELANLYPNARPSRIAKQEADNLLQAMKKTKFVAPQTDCLSPIGEELLRKSLEKEFDADFFATITRPAAVYRGNPFIIEAGIAFGGSLDKESNAELIRFANKVPLQYQQSACSITKSVTGTKWKQYGLHQSNGNLPVGPVVIVVHMASVWVPFTSESKESIAHYPEIIKEIKLAVQECGRQLGKYIKKQHKTRDEEKKKSYLEKYVPIIGEALKEILSLDLNSEKEINEKLKDYLERSRSK